MSEKLVAQKLIIKPGAQVRIVKPPIDIVHLLGTLPEGANLVDISDGAETILPADLILLLWIPAWILKHSCPVCAPP